MKVQQIQQKSSWEQKSGVKKSGIKKSGDQKSSREQKSMRQKSFLISWITNVQEQKSGERKLFSHFWMIWWKFESSFFLGIFFLVEMVLWPGAPWFSNWSMDPPNMGNFFTPRAKSLWVLQKFERRLRMKRIAWQVPIREFLTYQSTLGSIRPMVIVTSSAILYEFDQVLLRIKPKKRKDSRNNYRKLLRFWICMRLDYYI
jgi:hypothetical protein